MDFKEYIKAIQSLLILIILLAAIAISASIYLVADPGLTAFKEFTEVSQDQQDLEQVDLIKDGVHVRTGLLDGKGLQEVINNCTSCHSAKLITQNRMNRDRWLATIRWMQETQNLHQLGENENLILDYLAEKYSPEDVGRRANLNKVEWYELKDSGIQKYRN